MEAVWGGVLSFLFILATLSGYGAGTPQLDRKDNKSEQSDKKDDDKKNEDKKNDDKKNEQDKSGDHDRSGRKPGHKGQGTSRQRADFCVKDCPQTWRLRQ
jgi:hypothetical protein